jgi:hypothetical protein
MDNNTEPSWRRIHFMSDVVHIAVLGIAPKLLIHNG